MRKPSISTSLFYLCKNIQYTTTITMYNMAIQHSAPLSSTIFYLSRTTIQKNTYNKICKQGQFYLHNNLYARSYLSIFYSCKYAVMHILFFIQQQKVALYSYNNGNTEQPPLYCLILHQLPRHVQQLLLSVISKLFGENYSFMGKRNNRFTKRDIPFIEQQKEKLS